jgi:hypothetical protein
MNAFQYTKGMYRILPAADQKQTNLFRQQQQQQPRSTFCGVAVPDFPLRQCPCAPPRILYTSTSRQQAAGSGQQAAATSTRTAVRVGWTRSAPMRSATRSWSSTPWRRRGTARRSTSSSNTMASTSTSASRCARCLSVCLRACLSSMDAGRGEGHLKRACHRLTRVVRMRSMASRP